jgi:hypothetical protein
MTKIRKTLFTSVDQGVLSTNQSVELIESEVEADDIDTRIPEDTQIRPFGVLLNERAHSIQMESRALLPRARFAIRRCAD